MGRSRFPLWRRQVLRKNPTPSQLDRWQDQPSSEEQMAPVPVRRQNKKPGQK